MAQQARRQGRLEKHGAFARADFSRAHAAERALGGVAAHGFGAGRRAALRSALNQPSRCMASPWPAMTETEKLWRELA